jgi:hypothetical protein
MKRPRLTKAMALAAAADVANRSMRAAGRTAWSVSDYNAAVRELERLWPEPAPSATRRPTAR